MNDLLRELYNAGEEIVGIKLASKMTNEQLDAFEQLIAANNEAGALKWLETNFPDYREVAEQTFEELDGALRAAAAAVRPEIGDAEEAERSGAPAVPPDAAARSESDADPH